MAVIIGTGMTVGGDRPDIISTVRMATLTDTTAGMGTAVTGADGQAMATCLIRATFTSMVIPSALMAILDTGTTASFTDDQATPEVDCSGARWRERSLATTAETCGIAPGVVPPTERPRGIFLVRLRTTPHAGVKKRGSVRSRRRLFPVRRLRRQPLHCPSARTPPAATP